MANIDETTDLRPLQECAEFAKIDRATLRELIRTRRGTPTMITLKRGVDLVVWPEFLDWLNRSRVSGPEREAVLDRCRPTKDEAARRRRVRVSDQRRG